MAGGFSAMKMGRQHSNIKSGASAFGSAGALYGVGLLVLAAARSLIALLAALRATHVASIAAVLLACISRAAISGKFNVFVGFGVFGCPLLVLLYFFVYILFAAIGHIVIIACGNGIY